MFHFNRKDSADFLGVSPHLARQSPLAGFLRAGFVDCGKTKPRQWVLAGQIILRHV